TAVSGDVPIRLSALGTITPLATVTVKTQISGQLQQIAFMEGQMIEKGQFLAQNDPRPYENALAQAEGVLARDEAQKANVDRDAQRYADLVTQHLVSEQQLATQRALAAQMIGTVATDKAQVAAAHLNLQYAHIVAPVSGRAGLRQVDVGNYVTPGDPSGQRAGSDAPRAQRGHAARRSVRPQQHEPARGRHAADRRQRARHDHGHAEAARRVRQSGRAALPESVR